MLIGLDGKPIKSVRADEGMEKMVNDLISSMEGKVRNMIMQKITREIKPLKGKLSPEVITKIAELILTKVAMKIDDHLGVLHPEIIDPDA